MLPSPAWKCPPGKFRSSLLHGAYQMNRCRWHTTWSRYSWPERSRAINSPWQTCPTKYSPSKSATCHEPTPNCVFLTRLKCSVYHRRVQPRVHQPPRVGHAPDVSPRQDTEEKQIISMTYSICDNCIGIQWNHKRTTTNHMQWILRIKYNCCYVRNGVYIM